MLSCSAYLRRHKLGRTAERGSRLAVPHILLAKTVVGDLDVTFDGEKDVVELEIAVEREYRIASAPQTR
jgi:hypothetical protein